MTHEPLDGVECDWDEDGYCKCADRPLAHAKCDAEIERLSDQIARQAAADGSLAAAFDAVRLTSGIKAAIVIRLIAGDTDQTYTPTEVSTMVAQVVDEQYERLARK